MSIDVYIPEYKIPYRVSQQAWHDKDPSCLTTIDRGERERVLTWAVSTPQRTVLSGERLVHPSALSVVVVPTFQGGVVLAV